MRTYTEIGTKKGYGQGEIDRAILNVKWESFRTENLPFCQGESIKAVIDKCKIPIQGITRMDLYNTIKETHGFYALDVKYKNGQAQIYIADDGCGTPVVASDFTRK